LLISSDSLDSSSDDGEVAEASLYFRPSEETKATKRAVLKPKILDRDKDFLS